MKVKDFIPTYKAFKLKTCKLSTVSTYMMTIKHFILPILGEYELEAISSKEAELLKLECKNKGLSKNIYLFFGFNVLLCYICIAKQNIRSHTLVKVA